MPEYLAPGVYIEETSFRSKSIEGVSTSTAGFVGPARYGPISGEAELLTSFADFQRIYGGLEDLVFDGAPQVNFLAHAVRAFFEEGGRRLYVSRIFDTGGDAPPLHYGGASVSADPSLPVNLRARFPGRVGNLRVVFALRVGRNIFNANPPGGGAPTITRLRDYDVVHVSTAPLADGTRTAIGPGLYVARRDVVNDRWEFIGDVTPLRPGEGALAGGANAEIRVLTATVAIFRPTVGPNGEDRFGADEVIGEFSFDPRSRSGLWQTFSRRPSTRLERLTIPFAIELGDGDDADKEVLLDEQVLLLTVEDLLGATALGTLLNDRAADVGRQRSVDLEDGDDGALPDVTSYQGITDTGAFEDYVDDPLQTPKNGLLVFEELEDVSIVAAPGYSDNSVGDADRILSIHNAVINHCERMRYRIAVLDAPPNQLATEALAFRNQRSSTHAAIYYPWVTILNPLVGGRLKLPPSGFIAGIYARNDVENAVFKAPANEVVRLAIDFEQRIGRGQQELLNPEGVNCLRFFEGRGFLVWGARTISDDPEWKYVSLRRYFAYLERSIERGTQWVVFENNGPQLWANVRRTVEDFLFNEWKMGGLLGDKPEQAFFVRCDLSTMTQNDLDNGRLVCLIGIAPVRPAEFVIFRIGQMTLSGAQ